MFEMHCKLKCPLNSKQKLPTNFFDITLNEFTVVVTNCGGRLMATPDSASIAVPPRWPDYDFQCVWEIVAENPLSRINITIDYNWDYDYDYDYYNRPGCRDITIEVISGTKNQSIFGFNSNKIVNIRVVENTTAFIAKLSSSDCKNVKLLCPNCKL